MKPAQVLKEINELRETWRKQNFYFTNEQQAQFDRLKDLRRERVKYFYANGLVSKGGSKATADTKQP
tara:strand:- start:593 stop:793 length:201 start_codon:yes stop_codon:yes gene_type:complete